MNYIKLQAKLINNYKIEVFVNILEFQLIFTNLFCIF